MENFRPEELHDYPPRITCRIYCEENAPERATCSMSLTGPVPTVEFHIPLKAPKQKVAVVDTVNLQVNVLILIMSCVHVFSLVYRLQLTN